MPSSYRWETKTQRERAEGTARSPGWRRLRPGSGQTAIDSLTLGHYQSNC
jgi:hypothetical protein